MVTGNTCVKQTKNATKMLTNGWTLSLQMYSIAPIDGHSTDLRGVIGNLDSGKNGVIGSNMACKYCKNEQNLLAECENNYEGIEAYLLKDENKALIGIYGWYDNIVSIDEQLIEIKYCPMCGERLTKQMIEILFIVIVTLFLTGVAVFVLLNFLGVDVYPRPKFTCSECEQLAAKYGLYDCKACKDEVTGEPLPCSVSRGTKECYKNARKASNEQQASIENKGGGINERH